MIKILEKLFLFESDDFFKKHEIEKISDYLGFSKKEQAYYGWSHRAIHGFKIGDKCKGDLGLGDGYTFKEGDILKTLDDCKQRAIDFAKSVS